MRKAEREVTNIDEILSIIQKCDVCRLGMVDNNIPYIVPMNFGYEIKEDTLTLFFHCAKEGRKIDILSKSPTVCFEMDCSHQLIEGTTDCNYGFEFESIIGLGKTEFINDYHEKVHALTKIMESLTEKRTYHFSENSVKHVMIFKVTSNDFTGKRKKQ